MSRIEERLHEVLSGDDMWGWLLRNSGYSRGLIPSEVGRYLREQCRHAAAHARGGLVINPDDGAHQYKMGAAALLLRKLARQAMQGDIGLGVNRWDQNDHSSPAPPLSASSTAKL